MRHCIVCSHSEREAIDQALVAGRSFRDIEGQWKVSRSALHRHKAHVSDAMVEARAGTVVSNASSLLDQVHEQISRCRKLVGEAEKIMASAGDERVALKAIDTACRPIRELRGYLELLAEVTGELDRSSTTQVEVTQQVAIVQGLPRRQLLERLVEAGHAAARELQEMGNE